MAMSEVLSLIGLVLMAVLVVIHLIKPAVK